MNKKTQAIVLMLLCSSLLLYSEEKIAIRFSPPIGERVEYIVTSLIQSSGSNLLGNDISMNASSNGSITLEVLRVTKNNVYTNLTSDDLLITVQSLSSTRSFNLTTKDGKALRVVFDRTGKVSEVTNLRALKKQNLMNFSLVQIIRNYFPILPNKPVGVGDSWTENSKLAIPFQGMQLQILLSVKYTLDSIMNTQIGQEASISVDYSVSLQGRRAFGGGTAHFKGNGTGTGYLHFLVSRGYFSEYRLDYEISGNVSVKNKDKLIMSIPISFTANALLEAAR
jgi:hypothetical protein